MLIEHRYLDMGGRSKFVRDCYLDESERVQRSSALKFLQEQQYVHKTVVWLLPNLQLVSLVTCDLFVVV